MALQHDELIDIATGKSRKETSWKNKSVLWSTLVEKVSTTTRTHEKYAEYVASKRDRQAEIKDVGGFVGGYMNRGRRKSGSVVHRQLVTLDIDYGSTDFWKEFTAKYPVAACMYTTHAHTPERPRYRLLIPLDREVFCDEYIAIARWIAGEMGIDLFDDTTYQPERLMYWPSTSIDGEFICHVQDMPFLNADTVLGNYHDWKDSSAWPVSTRHRDSLHKAALKAGDPLAKPGVVGAFCRAYDIETAIVEFLGDCYSACDVEGRYTYLHGSTAAGLVIYEDKFAYSHHGTDPASGKLCNAFDLVRLHKFGLMDEEAAEGTPVNKLPSYAAMVDFARQDGAVRVQIVNDRQDEAEKAFEGLYADIEEVKQEPAVNPAGIEPVQVLENVGLTHSEGTEYEENDEWKERLEVDKKGNVQATIDNIVLVLENDPRLKGAFAFDEFESRPVALRRLPWRSVNGPGGRYLRDSDDANLSHYLEKAYDISNSAKLEKALQVVFERYRIHPVREYLGRQVWDGVKRVDSLLIDYLGCPDSEYVRIVTRKSLAAAVARVFEPGCKFDYILTLIGDQGDKKSTFVAKLGGPWFSDSLSTVQGREAAEQLQGCWIIEVAELAGFKRADVEAVKHFTAKQVDRFRAAYGVLSANYYRQCVFIATTNKRDFLQDITGNRRFWPVETDRSMRIKDPAEDMTPAEVGQIWAEAVKIYQAGEKLYLDERMEEEARAIQADHMEQDDRKQIVIDYLEKLLPDEWENMGLMERRAFLAGSDEWIGTRQRTRVTIGEIWTEALGCPVKDMTRFNTAPLHTILAGLREWAKYDTKIKGRYGVQRGYARKGHPLIGFSHVPTK